MPDPRDMRRASTLVLSLLMVLIGIAMVVSTLARGGGPAALGLLLGVLFCLVGAGRLYLEARR